MSTKKGEETTWMTCITKEIFSSVDHDDSEADFDHGLPEMRQG